MFLCTHALGGNAIKNRDYLIIGQNSVQRIYYETSSSFSEIHGGDKALDRDGKTSWVSSNEKKAQWFTLDFGVKRLMTKIVIQPGKKDNYRTLKYFKLQFLYDETWFDFATVNLENPDKGNSRDRAEIDLTGIDASIFRIYIPEDATYRGYAAIAEIESYLGFSKIRYFDERLKGLMFPVRNGFLPENDSGYPNASRSYRGGTHVGIDIFYYHTDGSYDPVAVTKETPVLSVDDGEVIRCDWDYEPMTPGDWKNLSAYTQSHPRTFVKRSFGGRQIWIDHKNGIVSAYNHLSKIDPDIKKGSRVKKGDRIGWAGNSGLYGEAEGKDYGTHLHLEIWIDGYFLGYGMPPDEIKKYVRWIFFPSQ